MKKLLSIALLTGSLLFSGCGSSENFVFTNNNPVQVAPVCQDDAYTTTQNQALSVNAANGVLANDEPNGGTLTFATTSAQGGTIAGNADGSFVFTPAADFNGSDSFTYTLANNAGQVTCTVNITVISTNGYFVDSVNGDDGTGSFTNGMPFRTIQAAVAAAPNGADIVVLPGSYTGTVNLKENQRLLGSGSGLVNAQGDARPQLTGPVVLDDGNTLDFLRVEGANADAVDGNGQNNGTVTNCEILNTVGDGIGLESVLGSWTISMNTISGTSGPGVFGVKFSVTGTGTMADIFVNDNDFSNNGGAIGLLTEDTAEARAQVHDNTMTMNTGVGSAFELECRGSSNFCLDLETNTNDDTFSFFDAPGGGVLTIEQRDELNVPQPTGAGNTGNLEFNLGVGDMPADALDGDCFQ